ncbi:MAG TPA: segregation/condensation protein A [bacterium]|nr:segregation/condensation protein A [bacterium]
MSENESQDNSTKGPVEITLSNSIAGVVIKEIINQDDQRPTYQITLPSFDGPMDLLLHLIREHELDIYDIPISRITRDYLDYLEIMRSLNLEIAGDFLVMAATLMQIKSRMLLPVDPTPDEPQEDPRLELMRRLIEYKKFKDAADQLVDMEKNRFHLLPRNVPADLKQVGEEEHLEEVSLFGLLAAFKDVLIHTQEDVTAELVRPEITVSQKINDLMDVLQTEQKIVFRPLLTACRTKIEKIVALLALLELIRLKLVRVVQDKIFGEIEVHLVSNIMPDNAPETV